MSGAHYSHKLSWSSLADFYRSHKHPPIVLPIGECSNIHIINNRTKHQLKNRPYLQDKICSNKDCETTGEKEFRKKDTLSNQLFLDRSTTYKQHAIKDEFYKKFLEAIDDYLETMKPNTFNSKDYPKDYPMDQLTFCDQCNLFIMLMETKNVQALEKYSVDQLKNLFGCTHGGQAVGRNLPFIFFHVVRVYMITNIIFASDSISNTENWSSMKPYTYFRGSLMYACDGQTFLPTCRKYLTEEVYMKDLVATRDLCKRCFEFICIYVMMERKIRSNVELDVDCLFGGLWR